VIRKKQVIVVMSIALVSFLIGTSMATDGGNPWDKVWTAIIELQNRVNNLNSTLTSEMERLDAKIVDLQGQIEVLQSDIGTLQTRIDSLDASLLRLEAYLETRIITVETSLIELQSKMDTLEADVEELENQSIPPGFVSAPAYDSGWLSIEQGEELFLTHNLNTTEVYVYMIGKSDVYGVHQQSYGGNEVDGRWRSARWYTSATCISVYRFEYDTDAVCQWNYVRVMIWIIQEPST